MRTHPSLSQANADDLRGHLDLPERDPDTDPGGAEPGDDVPSTTTAKAKRAARRVASAGVNRVAGPAIDTRVNSLVDETRAQLEARMDHIERRQAELQTGVALAVNQELLKAEFRSVLERLDQFGHAIAPDAGIEAVPSRFAELVARLDVLDRRTRTAPAPTEISAADSAAVETSADTGGTVARDVGPESAGFDYMAFEQRFRGSSDELAAVYRNRYGDLLAGHSPVVDVGCGRGELLAELRAAGMTVMGVELDPQMATEARSNGLDVADGDAVAWLEDQPDGSLGAIVSVHVVEHLPLETLLRFIGLAARKLEPGGPFIAETPNPASLIVLGSSYILDPTHVWPLHPSLMTFLCERAGMTDIELRYYSPADSAALPHVESDGDPALRGELNAIIDKLNVTLFGPQEYGIVGHAPVPPSRPA